MKMVMKSTFYLLSSVATVYLFYSSSDFGGFWRFVFSVVFNLELYLNLSNFFFPEEREKASRKKGKYPLVVELLSKSILAIGYAESCWMFQAVAILVSGYLYATIRDPQKSQSLKTAQ